MATAHDVAAYFVNNLGPMTALKMQKLCYYAQAWSLTTVGAPLFTDPITAGPDGPDVPSLFGEHLPGEAEALAAAELSVAQFVLSNYGHFTDDQLATLSKAEDPWHQTSSGISVGDGLSEAITHASLAEFYGALLLEEPNIRQYAEELLEDIEAYDAAKREGAETVSLEAILAELG